MVGTHIDVPMDELGQHVESVDLVLVPRVSFLLVPAFSVWCGVCGAPFGLPQLTIPVLCIDVRVDPARLGLTLTSHGMGFGPRPAGLISPRAGLFAWCGERGVLCGFPQFVICLVGLGRTRCSPSDLVGTMYRACVPWPMCWRCPMSGGATGRRLDAFFSVPHVRRCPCVWSHLSSVQCKRTHRSVLVHLRLHELVSFLLASGNRPAWACMFRRWPRCSHW